MTYGISECLENPSYCSDWTTEWYPETSSSAITVLRPTPISWFVITQYNMEMRVDSAARKPHIDTPVGETSALQHLPRIRLAQKYSM